MCLLLQVIAAEIFAEGLLQNRDNNKPHSKAEQQEAAVIERGIDPRRGHRHTEELIGHILGPERRAGNIVDEEAQERTEERTPVDAVLPPLRDS